MSSSNILRAVKAHFIRREMVDHVVKSILKMENRPSNADAFKFFALKWLLTKSCKVVSGDSSSGQVPEDFKERNEFQLRYKTYLLSLIFSVSTSGIAATLAYWNKNISKSIIESFDTLPDIDSVQTNEERDEIIRQYCEIAYSIDCEFYRPILHFMHKGEEPCSTATTPKSVHSRR